MAALLTAGTLVACGDGQRTVAVRVSIPGLDSTITPVPGVGLIALPYDRDSVLRALAERATTPRPDTTRLDSLLVAFRGPFAAYARASYEADRLRDSLAGLKTRLDSLSRGAPEYGTLYDRFARQSGELATVERRLDSTRVILDAARKRLGGQGDSLRAVIRRWEDSTYRGYDSLVRTLAQRTGRAASTDTTDATGWAHLTLKRGTWWLYARSWDASDPYREWYWNVRADRDTVFLTPQNGVRKLKR